MIYLISGLGADERVFKYLNLADRPSTVIRWENAGEGESLESYCKKLIRQIDTQTEVVLIGVSFGGIIAQEIAAQIPVKKLILISSIKSPREFDWKLQMAKYTGIYRMIPAGFLKKLNRYTTDFYFGVESTSESELLRQILKDTDTQFLKWAIHAIMSWKGAKNDVLPIHFHGSNDRFFPIKNMKNFILIENAGHFMIVNRSGTISDLINSLL